MSQKKKINRREFLKSAATAAGVCGVPYFVPSLALGKGGIAAASERITLGLIDVGIKGTGHVKAFLGYRQVQIVAVCDLYRSRREAAKKRVEDSYGSGNDSGVYKGCDTYNDFREMLARDDIDAVVIATPEHWHALTAIAAAKAGKDVYSEKSLSLTVSEGRAMCKAVRRYGRVFQVGTQQRSSRNFRFACELVRNGYIGKLHTVEVAVPKGSRVPKAPNSPVPAGFDYDTWLGPALFKPYSKNRVNNPDRGYNHPWYHIYDYCVGWISAWGSHHLDIAQWGAPSLVTSQLEVEGEAVFPTDGFGNTSLTWRVEFVTPDGLRLRFSDNGYYKQGCRFEGDKGWVHVKRGRIYAEPKSLLTATIKPGEEHLYESDNHRVNFLECVRSRREPIAPVEAGHSATTLGNIADIATRLGGRLAWDWKSERFINNDMANRMLSRAMRSPWSL